MSEIWEHPLCCHSRCFPTCPDPNPLHRLEESSGCSPGTGMAHGGTGTGSLGTACGCARRFRSICKPHGGVTGDIPVCSPVSTIRVLWAPSAGNAGEPRGHRGPAPGPAGMGLPGRTGIPRPPCRNSPWGSPTAAPGTPETGSGDGAPWGCAGMVTPGEKRGWSTAGLVHGQCAGFPGKWTRRNMKWGKKGCKIRGENLHVAESFS